MNRLLRPISTVRNKFVSGFGGHGIIGHEGAPPTDLEPYLEQLRGLPFVKRVDIRRPDRSSDQGGDALLSLCTPKGRRDLAIEVKTMPLTRSAAQSLIARAARNPVRQWVAFSPYISPPVGTFSRPGTLVRRPGRQLPYRRRRRLPRPCRGSKTTVAVSPRSRSGCQELPGSLRPSCPPRARHCSDSVVG